MIRRRRLAVAITFVALVPLAACGNGSEESLPRTSATAKLADPGPVHIHGLGINPGDGALFIATHTGLFRSAPGARRSTRVADRYQDTMGFTVAGPDVFLGSGHPDGREGLPPFLGLIRSTDAGQTWKPISLLGKVDFHVLEASEGLIYGYGSDFESREPRFLASSDGGRAWRRLRAPEPLISLALAPQDPKQLIASGERGLYRSRDGGQSWQRTRGPAGLVVWTDDAWIVVTLQGAVSVAPSGQGFSKLGDIGGQPGAFEAAADGALYVALHDGTIKRSADSGRTWAVRSRP